MNSILNAIETGSLVILGIVFWFLSEEGEEMRSLLFWGISILSVTTALIANVIRITKSLKEKSHKHEHITRSKGDGGTPKSSRRGGKQ